MPVGEDMQRALQRLSSGPGLDAPKAANKWAGTVGLDIVRALNVKASKTGMELNGVCKALAAANGGNGSLDGQAALASIP